MRPSSLHAAAVGLAVLALASAAVANGSGASPFIPGGPLAPWTAPVPRLQAPSATLPAAQPKLPYYIPGESQPAAPAAPALQPNAVQGNALGAAPVSSFYVPGLGEPGASADAVRPVQPLPSQPARDVVQGSGSEAKGEGRTWVSLTANPALLPWGRMAARVEVAPLAAHALFFEYGRWQLPIEYKALGQSVSREVPINEYGFGYHLYPQGRGVSGFYLGPRFIYARGETAEAVGTATAWGADLGYQLVIARHIVLNVGIGAVHLKARAEAKPGVVDQLTQAVSGEGSSFTGKVELGKTLEQWVPLPTLGLGVAF
jgi:hypothetical protein